jgi:signal transduction histidine kinase
MSQRTARADAVFIFDQAGRRIAANEEADARFPDARIERLDDLAHQLTTPSGAPLRLRPGDVQMALSVRPAAGTPVHVQLEELLAADRAGQVPARTVRISDVEPADDAILYRALGGILAHELRTPLTTIYGGAQLIADPAASESTRLEAAKTVAREAQHLHDIIEDLVVLVRFDKIRSTDVEPLLLQRILLSVVQLEQALHPTADIHVSLPRDLPPVLAAEGPVQHAFRNLLSAALFYGPNGGTVDVHARLEGEDVVLIVMDEGPELSAEESSHAFDLFTRSPRTTGDPSGVNLGAYVSGRLVEAMGGRIWAKPVDGGMEAGITLPVAQG